MATKRDLLENILLETRSCLQALCSDEPRASDCLNFINSIDIRNSTTQPIGIISKHHKLLEHAISSITDKRLLDLKLTIEKAKDHLHWKVDEGGYYDNGADVGEGYKHGNMHTLLIGPENSLIKADDFLLGLFLLSPKTLYRDHNHLAPEIYVPLTGPSGWRFDLGDWNDLEAGSVIFNSPDQVHATRNYDVPFFAIFCWPRDIASRCNVVQVNDWGKIEDDLRK